MSSRLPKLGHERWHLHSAELCFSKRERGSLCMDWERSPRWIRHKNKTQKGVDKTQPLVLREERT